MNRCKTCGYRDEEGFCTNGHIHEADVPKEPEDLVYFYDEGAGFWAGPDFGCIHHDATAIPKTEGE